MSCDNNDSLVFNGPLYCSNMPLSHVVLLHVNVLTTYCTNKFLLPCDKVYTAPLQEDGGSWHLSSPSWTGCTPTPACLCSMCSSPTDWN